MEISRHIPTRPLFASKKRAHPFILLMAGALLLCAGATLTARMVFSLINNPLFAEQSDTRQVVDAVQQPFPVGVDPARKEIVENEDLGGFLEDYGIRNSLADGSHRTWIGNALSVIAQSSIFQNLASAESRILVIRPGERKEEVAKHFGDILRWDADQRTEFLTLITTTEPILPEGTFAPATYITARRAEPAHVAQLVHKRFVDDIGSRYTEDVEARIPLEDALTIASLLEREAYDFEDMRLISGVIWKRLFADMNLQIDATLQYVKGTTSTSAWWPKVNPEDKYLDSPFNTYANDGLPPSPIANPSAEAVLAALNPRNTDCFYYFHDRRGAFYCSPTYEEHVQQLKKIYGRGK